MYGIDCLFACFANADVYSRTTSIESHKTISKLWDSDVYFQADNEGSCSLNWQVESDPHPIWCLLSIRQAYHIWFSNWWKWSMRELDNLTGTLPLWNGSMNHLVCSLIRRWVCKLRLYTLHTSLMIGRSLIVCACVDRYFLCSQSVSLRSFCDPTIPVRIIIGHFLIWPLIPVQIPILQVFSDHRCVMASSYVLIYGFYSTLAAGLLPPLLMTIFSVLAIRHRHRLRSRVTAFMLHSRRNNTLIVMLSAQVIVYVVTTSLYPATALYRALTDDSEKSGERLQIENFITFIGGSFLIYLNPASSFYVYLVASKQFRKDFRIILIHFFDQCIGRPTRILPRWNRKVRIASIGKGRKENFHPSDKRNSFAQTAINIVRSWCIYDCFS